MKIISDKNWSRIFTLALVAVAFIYGHETRGSVDRLNFEDADTNHNHFVSRQEFRSALAQYALLDSASRFKTFDINKDQRLNLQEFANFLDHLKPTPAVQETHGSAPTVTKVVPSK